MFFAGDSEEEYGLYIMDTNCPLHRDGMYLIYYFDGDKFIHRGETEKVKFISSHRIKTLKDEFGNEYMGEALEKRLLECMRAYREELPGYIAYCKESEDIFNRAEENIKDAK